MTALVLSSGRQFRSVDALLDYADELEETVTQLRGELGQGKNAEEMTRLHARWRLTGKEGDMLAYLYSRGGMTASKEQILFAVYQQSPETPEIKIVDVFICKIRAKIGADLILTEWGRGYRLSAEGLAAVKAVLETPLPQIERCPLPGPRTAGVHYGSVQASVLLVAAKLGPVTVADVASACGWRKHNANSAVTRLRRAGLLEYVDWRKNATGHKHTVYGITEAGRNYLRAHLPAMSEVAA